MAIALVFKIKKPDDGLLITKMINNLELKGRLSLKKETPILNIKFTELR